MGHDFPSQGVTWACIGYFSSSRHNTRVFIERGAYTILCRALGRLLVNSYITGKVWNITQLIISNLEPGSSSFD